MHKPAPADDELLIHLDLGSLAVLLNAVHEAMAEGRACLPLGFATGITASRDGDPFAELTMTFARPKDDAPETVDPVLPRERAPA